MKTENDRAKEQARAQIESIVEMVKALDLGTEADRDEARQRIQEDPLSVQIRSGWYDPGSKDRQPEEFCILLCTGGPAVRIVGELSQHCEPDAARIEFQDWGTPWEEFYISEETERMALLQYCQQFYFGE